jgi:hypothetical protein
MEYSVLAKSYNTLQYQADLKQILAAFYKGKSFEGLSKHSLHRIVNDALIQHYQGEETLKFMVAELFRMNDDVAAFEVRVNGSRADFLVINGQTKCFEIKSRVDTLKRLKKQTEDFGDVFEYNTIVTDQKHLRAVEELVVPHYGIWYFDEQRRIEHRKPLPSPYLDPQSQLGLMAKRELLSVFGSSDIGRILSNNSGDYINLMLKDVLKNRYAKRWAFIRDNWEQILPVDLQFFFNSNINPRTIYGQAS